MNKIISLVLIFLASNILAQRPVDFNPEVEIEQQRIDLLDGLKDTAVRVKKYDEQEAIYKFVYFKLTDSLQTRINNSTKLFQWQKKNLLNGLALTLSEINEKNYIMPMYYQKLLENAFNMVGAVENGDLMSFLISDPLYSIKNIYFVKYFDAAKDFLIASTNTYPNEVMTVFNKYSERPYKDTIVEVCGIVAPNIAKNYLLGETEIKNILMNDNNPHPSIMGMRGFFAKYNILSKGMVIVDDIVEGKITIDEANTISQDKRMFLRKMIEIKNSDYAMAHYSLDEQLHNTSLEYVREINELHNESNPKIRFKCIDDFNWKELYTILIYSEEEIFTSTFNGVFERLMFRLNQDKISGDAVLNKMKYNRFRTFIKMCANFSKLNDFLATMPKDQSRHLLTKFTNGLDRNEGDLRSAINVANAFSSISDSVLIKFMKGNIDNEYLRVKEEKSKNGIAIYGLLKSLFEINNKKDTSWFKNMASQYKLKPIDKIEKSELFGKDKIHRQVHFFYDDEDGEASYSSFIATFSNSKYKITKFPEYVVIESTSGDKVKIFANHPKSEIEGQAKLIETINLAGKDIQMMVHRGHSYYAMNTIDQIPVNTKIVFLGSCGSYHNIHEVLNRAQNVHIISSKQIGVMAVNNPLLLHISESIREGKGVVWKDIWKKTEITIGKGSDAMNKFKDYVSPDKNLGAIFLQAYMRMVTNY